MTLFWILLLAVSGALCISPISFNTDPSTRQTPLSRSTTSSGGDILHLSSLSSDQYVTLTHPRISGHRVRIKKTEFCDSTVNAYTGYLDVDAGAKHLFFYFFESRGDPDKDDVMMWINGGPGSSSATGLLMELGPCNIDMSSTSKNSTTWNPYSWNEAANIFFLDQPVGVGFSYADFGETIETTEDAAKNVDAFIRIFFETFTQFNGRRLHLSGESYGGRYLPVFASEIYDQNQVANREGRPTLNLHSVLIGNGNTGISTLYPGRFEVECGTAALDKPFQAISTCVRMKLALPRCQSAMKEGCIDQFDLINCRAAINLCDSELSTGMWASGRNVYDISKMCIGDDLCYAENTAIKKYLNLPETRKMLGVESPSNFTLWSPAVNTDFDVHMDKWAVPTHYYVAGLLDRGIRILIYAGTYDWQCNWVSNMMWVDALEWSGAREYSKAQFRDWEVNGRKAGEVKSTPLLTFATVREAGHMVPHDKPEESLEMITRWIRNQEI